MNLWVQDVGGPRLTFRPYMVEKAATQFAGNDPALYYGGWWSRQMGWW